MSHRFTLTVILLAGFVHVAHAQTTAKPDSDSLTTRFVGVWDGRFVTDHGPAGGMQVTVAKDTAWKVSIEMAHGDQAIPSRVTSVTVAGKTISWSQDVMGMTCAASATVDGANMTGEASCGQMSYKMELQRK
jgi:hypothetical protein